MNSTHVVQAVKLKKIERHPNAETLEWSQVDGYSVVFKENQYVENEIVAFVPPENIMPQTEEYSWLGPSRRVKARKIRGIPSFGLLLKIPDGMTVCEGEDLTDYFGVTHYDPPVEDSSNQGEDASAPPFYVPTYDLESLNKYHNLFEDGEPVKIFEKLEGQNIRACFHNDQFYVGSHYRWKKDSEFNVFWRSVRFTPGIEDFCRNNEGVTIFGESIGNVRGFSYGVPKGETRVFVSDIFKDGKWLEYDQAKSLTEPFGFKWAPCVAEKYPYNFEEICKMGEEKTRVEGANHISEGLVVSGVPEKYDVRLGRVKLKYKSVAYLERK